MTRQKQFPLNLKAIARAALIALGLAILLGKLDAPAAQLTNFFGLAARATLDLLASLAYTLDHQWFSPCPLQLLISFRPLLHFVAGVV